MSGKARQPRRWHWPEVWHETTWSTRAFGWTVWTTGGELRIGQQVYRAKWGER